jgi:hypothetical protein|tara:strand:+ start:729 stop:968 length:240 start_codon:yes stop_codon:yes gene_type:complete
MIIIKPTAPPRTEVVVRDYDDKLIKWVEKPLSALTKASLTQFNPLTNKYNWFFDHYVWVIESIKPNRKKEGKRKRKVNV